jgi:hypothetical protein
MDLIKNQYGFKLQNVMTSGVGSIGKPTIVFILVTKQNTNLGIIDQNMSNG